MPTGRRSFPQRAVRVGAVLALGALSACTAVTRPGPGAEMEYTPSYPVQPTRDPASAYGSVYEPTLAINLVADARARRVGDIITVVLQERTQAEKSANTDLTKGSSTSASIASSGELGGFLGDGDRSLAIGNDTEFSGEADTDQSNRLEGQIAVIVSQVLPNGNLVVQGEKWITLNQGEEFLRLRGIVRPMDIADNNSIPSTRVADARITYSGRGPVADSNMPSWLTRFFLSPAWLF